MACSDGVIEIALVLDVSPSVILANAIAACQAGVEAIKAANIADGGTRRVMLTTFSYLGFADGIWQGTRAVVGVDLTTDMDLAKTIIGTLMVGNATDIEYAIRQTKNWLVMFGRPGAQVSMILISDGQWNRDLNPAITELDPVPAIATMLADHPDWKFFAVDTTSAAPPAGVPGDVMYTVGKMGNGYAAGTTQADIADAIVSFADPCSTTNITNTTHGQWAAFARLKRC